MASLLPFTIKNRAKIVAPITEPKGETPEIFPHTTSSSLLHTANGSVIAFVEQLIARAEKLRASDIHIDPRPGDTSVRFRIDGVLQPIGSVPKNLHDEIISRIKVCARLRSDEHQTPQDGRFRTEVETGHSIDIRVSIAPTYYGENAVLRLLIEQRHDLSLETLGFSSSDCAKIIRAVQKPTGMILATGPTGSGKTTTLYSCIKLLNTPDISIVTIEDPIEYAIEGVRQIQVNPGTKLTFASGLRSLLRQDPDIIMVGEIRDRETAGIAVNTALTGHRLLSTLHTNDAATTVPRLLDMGIEPYTIASTVSVIIAQRLVRKICENCKEPYHPTDLDVHAFQNTIFQKTRTDLSSVSLFHGRGCDTCSNTGYRGRVSVNEVLVIEPEIRKAILAKASATLIKNQATTLGMTTMMEDGLHKATSGITTIRELLRVIQE